MPTIPSPEPQRDPIRPGEMFFGGKAALFDFQGNFDGADTIGYYRVVLQGGRKISNLRTFIEALGGGQNKTIRMGLYSQDDPLDYSLGPNAKIAETASVDVSSAAGTFVTEPLLTPYTPPVTGWYWLALANRNAGTTFRATGPYPAGFMGSEVLEESTTGDSLPVNASGSPLETAALYVAAVEDE